MTATTQRLTINQTWQQVGTGNVTLIGCNTAANYHINIGADKPTDKSAFVTDKLSEPTAYNYGVPVWVKLDVNNQIDEADLIVMGEAVVAISSSDDATNTPANSTSYAANWTLYNGTFVDGMFAYQGVGTLPVGYYTDYVNWHTDSNGYGATHRYQVGDKLRFTIDLASLASPNANIMIAFDGFYDRDSAPVNIDTLEYDRGYYINLSQADNSISVGTGRYPEFRITLPEAGIFTVDVEIINATTIRAIAKIDGEQIADVVNDYVSIDDGRPLWLRIIATNGTALTVPTIGFIENYQS